MCNKGAIKVLPESSIFEKSLNKILAKSCSSNVQILPTEYLAGLEVGSQAGWRDKLPLPAGIEKRPIDSNALL